MQLEEEADIEHELQNQLRNLVEENHALQSRSEAADLLLAKERAKRTGLQLQLLRSGILPHDLSEGTGSAADKQVGTRSAPPQRLRCAC